MFKVQLKSDWSKIYKVYHVIEKDDEIYFIIYTSHWEMVNAKDFVPFDR